MTYNQTLDYLVAQLPMFHRLGPAAYKANLDNTLALAKHFGQPERKFRSIHIAGTNGKGSVSHMLASIFQEAGYKTGLCTSPHLKDFRERFRINGIMISKKYVSEFVNQNRIFFEQLQPSFFEMTIAMAFCYFAEQEVDIAIIETGLGGRLDSTNIITPEVSVITNIGLDHTSLLGNTIEKIAWEKAGIIKSGIPFIVGKTHKKALEVIEQKAKEMNAPMYYAEKNFKLSHPSVTIDNKHQYLSARLTQDTSIHEIECGLTGTYQYENICTVAQTIDVIRNQRNFNIPEKAFHRGLKHVVENTGLKGRWQIIRKKPLVVCDTGHNPDGIKAVLKNISLVSRNHLHMVIGMVNDKDIRGILKLLPKEDTTYYFCKPAVPRGLDAEHLKQFADTFGLQGNSYPDVKTALAAAIRHANYKDMVFVGGSTFVVAEVI